jgi:CheY-like chemotaxis protein
MTNRGKILVVDDEVGFRDLYRYTLEPLGFEVVTANDGLDAVDLVAQEPFDLVILDVHMPRMRGPEALEKIRQLRPRQKVVIVSSSSDPTYAFENAARKKGALTCLFKPIDIDELIGIIMGSGKLESQTGQ